MSKRLITIVVGLFILQFGIFAFIEGEIKPEEVLKREIDDFQNIYGVFLNQFGQSYETSIDLSNFDLDNIPEKVYSFEKMETINLSDNHLTQFPYELLKLPNLKKIQLNDNQIQSIDFSKIQYSNLVVLELRNNKLHQLDNLKNLTSLSNIDLSKNELYKVPNLTSDALSFVNLGFNRIIKLEGKIGKGLLRLDLTANEISEINLEITGEEILSQLDLNQNYNLKAFPYDVLYFPFLSQLDLSNCNITSINEQPIINENLEKLNLNNNKITAFSINKIELRNLKELYLENNKLEKIEIVNPSIEGLILGSNRLTSNNLSLETNNLSELILTNNLLSDLPKSSIDAPNLLYLTIYNNQMSDNQTDKIKRQFIKN